MNLAYNNLTMLGPDAFVLEAPVDPLDSQVDPPVTALPFTLLLQDNPLVCNAILCWLKVSDW